MTQFDFQVLSEGELVESTFLQAIKFMIWGKGKDGKWFNVLYIVRVRCRAVQ